jgi:hypothetical protein
MNKPKTLALFILSILFLVFAHFADAAEDWKVYFKLDPFVESYDANSLSRPEKNVVRVQIKSTCAEKSKCKEFYKKSVRESKGKVNKAYEKWAYRLSSAEMQCKEKKMRLLSFKNVDENGKTIDSEEKPIEWMDVKNPFNEPDPIETLYGIVCK